MADEKPDLIHMAQQHNLLWRLALAFAHTMQRSHRVRLDGVKKPFDVNYSWDYHLDDALDNGAPLPDAEESTNFERTFRNIILGKDTTKFTIQLHAANASCSNTYSETIEVYDVPEAKFSISRAKENKCSPDTLILTNTSSICQSKD